jgi:hypothetical protein
MVPLRGFEPPDLLLTLQVLCQLSYNGLQFIRITERLSSSYDDCAIFLCYAARDKIGQFVQDKKWKENIPGRQERDQECLRKKAIIK